ncbi:MAG: CAP domain-containing protein [Desulfobulbaceae bacterium]
MGNQPGSVSRLLTILAIVIASLFLTGAGSALAAEKGVMAGMTEAHNTVRSELGLPQVAWSDDLAEFAREWAQYLADRNGCGMRHRPSQGNNAQLYGENLYWASAIRLANGARKAQNISPRHVVSSWVSERRDYDHVQKRCRWGKSCGHYVQVVWKTTRRIGCGMATCSDMSQIWVCNYDPPGNYRGQAPY